jgi:parallel beta-helix repeat protein
LTKTYLLKKELVLYWVSSPMRKTAAVTLILTGLLTLGVVCVQPIKAEYQGDISINADGSIAPSTAPIQQTGNTYTLTSDVNGSITVNRNNIVLDGKGNTITVSSIFSGGITLNDVSNVTVEDFTVTGGQFGINVWGTFNVIANNTITGVNNGIYSLDEPTAGIFLTSPSNVITGNNIESCLVGINFAGGLPGNCSYNMIVGNTLTDCSTALLFYDSSNNSIYHNNFYNNIKAVDDTGLHFYPIVVSINIWDDGYPGGGNYWSDYRTRYPQAAEIDNSKIGDTPYVIDSQNMDRYPLMYAFNEYYVRQANPPKVSLLSPVNRTYNETSVPLVFSVDKQVNWAGYSLDGQQNVTVTGNCTIANVTNGFHSVTVYANDTFGVAGASENVTFTVAVAPLERSEPFPTATIAAVIGATTAIAVSAGLLVYFKKRKR